MDNKELVSYLETRKGMKNTVGAQEWAARVDLAACYRLVAYFGMADWVYNHISLCVPGEDGHYLINPFGLMYEEVSASSLLKVNVEGRLVEESAFDVNPTAFVIHGAIHGARRDAACVLHTHTVAGIAVGAQAKGLLPVSQHALKLLGRLAYHDYEGIALDDAERETLISDLGTADVLLMRNHGSLTLGGSVAEAFELAFFLERACQIQLAATAGGMDLSLPRDAVCKQTIKQFGASTSNMKHRGWNALLRMLDRLDPSYRE